MSKLSHLDKSGQANMVDIAGKAVTARRAIARGMVHMAPATLNEIFEQGVAKGDVLAVARVAGIQAAKRCSDLIPLCHPLAISNVSLEFAAKADDRLEILAECRVQGQTGVEMEALTAVSIAALTVYDMCKAIDKAMVIESIALLRKEGGKSGTWERDA